MGAQRSSGDRSWIIGRIDDRAVPLPVEAPWRSFRLYALEALLEVGVEPFEGG